MFCTFLGLQPRGYIDDDDRYSKAWHEKHEFKGMDVYPSDTKPGDFNSLEDAIEYLISKEHHADCEDDIQHHNGYVIVTLYTCSMAGTETDRYIIIIDEQSIKERAIDWLKAKFYPKARYHGSDVVDIIHTWLITFTVGKSRGKVYDLRIALCNKLFICYFIETKRFVFNVFK